MNFLIRPISWLLGLLDILYYTLFLKPGGKRRKFFEEGYGDVNASMALRETINGARNSKHRASKHQTVTRTHETPHVYGFWNNVPTNTEYCRMTWPVQALQEENQIIQKQTFLQHAVSGL